MGNKGSGGNANKKAQAKRAQESGEVGTVVGFGGGTDRGGEPEQLVLTIRLIQLHPAVVAQAAVASIKSVSVGWHQSGYEVYWEGQRLGEVPSNYNDQLQYPTAHHGRITEITTHPRAAVTIKVLVSR